jgi:hypothetical protein
MANTPEELQLLVLRHAVPCGKQLTWANLNTDERNWLIKRAKRNKVDSPEYREELLQFETYVLPLLACFLTSRLAYEAFYTQNVPRISMLMVRKLAPHVCIFVRHITIDLRMWEGLLQGFASRAESAFGFSQLHTVVIQLRSKYIYPEDRFSSFLVAMPAIKIRTRRLTVEWKAGSSSVWATAFATGACSATFKFMEKLTIVAPDNKPPSAHWERFTVAGGGDLMPEQYYENWDSAMDHEFPRITRRTVWL